jgi:hypothetical protein
VIHLTLAMRRATVNASFRKTCWPYSAINSSRLFVTTRLPINSPWNVAGWAPVCLARWCAVALAVGAAYPIPLEGQDFGIADASGLADLPGNSEQTLFAAFLPDVSGDLVFAIALAFGLPIAVRFMVARLLGYTCGSPPPLRDAKGPLLKPFLNFATIFSCLALLLFTLCIWPTFEPGSAEAGVLLWAAFCLAVGSAFYASIERGREKKRLIKFCSVQNGQCESDDLERIRAKLTGLEERISFALLRKRKHKHK